MSDGNPFKGITPGREVGEGVKSSVVKRLPEIPA